MNNPELSPILRRVDALIKTKSRIILTLDGMAAAGKTSAAAALSARWNAPVIHMDDFFLPPSLRTPDRLAEPGGNIHYERFEAEVLPFLRAGGTFSHRVFDCSVMDYSTVRTLPAARVTIVEGAYAMHPRFGAYWDLSAFFAVDPDAQQARILHRDGESAWKRFVELWIPLETRYHTAFAIPRRADILIQTRL